MLLDEKLKVNFLDEIAHGLVLCPSDIDPSNFMITEKGEVFAINFGRTGYMPPSYVAYSLASWKPFTQSVARLVTRPPSDNLRAMSRAAYYFTITGRNSLGK